MDSFLKPTFVDQLPYPFFSTRRKTRQVFVGKVAIGSDCPVVIQSMLTQHTWKVDLCFQEIKDLFHAGAQLIRITIPSQRDLDAIPLIRKKMEEEGIFCPLIADIHFAPHLAVSACEWFEKVRINPGNISDRPKNFNPTAHKFFPLEEGRERLKERIEPFAKALLRFDRALRVGVNQGSLSQRMIQSYGDSARGMVQSALEAVEIFEELGVRKIVVSLKSSNPLVAEKAYRIFAAQNTTSSAVPLHLGVTEAGNDQMARIKSLCGIGPLLQDGIGDTLRVSLTEKSVNEIAFAKQVLNFLEHQKKHFPSPSFSNEELEPGGYTLPFDLYRQKHRSFKVDNPILEAVKKEGQNIKKPLQLGDGFPVALVGCVQKKEKEQSPPSLPDLFAENWQWDGLGYFQKKNNHAELVFENQTVILHPSTEGIEKIEAGCGVLFDFSQDIFAFRQFVKAAGEDCPVLGLLLPSSWPQTDFRLEILISGLVCEGLVDFFVVLSDAQPLVRNRLKEILQAVRVKLLKTDYVACPSCGRTLFDLQAVTKKIKEKTNHLQGVKIGIMGCMVNGPGEMADSDFGYVGSGENRVDLYVGQKKVEKNIPQEDALDHLVALMKEHGKWVEVEKDEKF